MARDSRACPGTCNIRYRDAWDAYDKALAGYDPMDPETSRPEEPGTTYIAGEPAWCGRCTTLIRQHLPELDDLAPLRMATADGHGADTGTEHTRGRSGDPASPSPGADDVMDLAAMLTGWEKAYRDLNGWDAPPPRGDLASTQTTCVAWLAHHLAGILLSPLAQDFGAEILLWHRGLTGPVKAGARTLRKPLRCPSCHLLMLFWTEGEKQVNCKNPDCGRVLRLDEYEAEVQRINGQGVTAA